jgi:hypothetical protein
MQTTDTFDRSIKIQDMLGITFVKNTATKNSDFSKLALKQIFEKNIITFEMAIPLKLPENNTDALIYLRDRFLCDEEDKRWETVHLASKRIDGKIKRQTIENWAKKAGDLIRYKPDSKPFVVWLPDVIFASEILTAFDQLEHHKIIQQTAVREGQIMYKYANMSDEISKKTIMETKGGIILDIVSNFNNLFSPDLVNQAQAKKSSFKSAHDLVVSQLDTNT